MADGSPHLGDDSTAVVVLWHDVGNGVGHYDWLIEIPGRRDEWRLLSFRCESGPDGWEKLGRKVGGGQLFHVEQLADHRAHFLEFQGDLGGGRGVVERVASGVCVGFGVQDLGGKIELDIVWTGSGGVFGDGEPVLVEYFGEKCGENAWCFSCG